MLKKRWKKNVFLFYKEENNWFPRKFTVKGLAEAFADLINLLNVYKSMDPNTEKFSLIVMLMVHDLLTR